MDWARSIYGMLNLVIKIDSVSGSGESGDQRVEGGCGSLENVG